MFFRARFGGLTFATFTELRWHIQVINSWIAARAVWFIICNSRASAIAADFAVHIVDFHMVAGVATLGAYRMIWLAGIEGGLMAWRQHGELNYLIHGCQ